MSITYEVCKYIEQTNKKDKTIQQAGQLEMKHMQTDQKARDGKKMMNQFK
jgi:hypothetical protein